MLGKRLFITTIATALLFSTAPQNVHASSDETELLTKRALRACHRELKHTLSDKTDYETTLDNMKVGEKVTSSIIDDVDLHTVQLSLNYTTASKPDGKAVCLFEWKYNTDFNKYLANGDRLIGVYKDDAIAGQEMLLK